MIKNLAIVIFMVLCGCSSVSVKVTTTPDKAKIYYIGKGNEKKLIGESPLSLNDDTLPKDMNLGEPSYLLIEKDGFVSEKILVTNIEGLEYSLNLKLETVDSQLVEIRKIASTAAPMKLFTLNEEVNSVVEALFDAQKAIHANNFEEANKKLDFVDSISPQLPATFQLRGAMYFIQKDYKKSLSAYRTAYQYSSNAPGLKALITKIEKMVGGK